MTDGKKRKRRSRNPGAVEPVKNGSMEEDVFEADDGASKSRENRVDAEVALGAEYELPSDFEDEEISEDQAFDEEDEAAFGAYFSKAKPKAVGTNFDERKAAPKGTTFLSDMLNSDDDSAAPPTVVSRPSHRSSDDEGSEGSEGSSDSEDEESEDKAEAVLRVVKGIVSAEGNSSSGARKKETTEAVPEGEFNTPQGKSPQLTLESMLRNLDPTSTKHGDLKKKLSKLAKAEKLTSASAGVVEWRAERKVGYKAAKKEVSKWTTIVQENRQAKSLNFPLNAPKPEKRTTLGLAAGFEAKTTLEKEIEEALEKSGMVGDKQVEEAENEELAEIVEDAEEVRRRRGELSKLRALMFYDEQKHKRQKKIKSKMYRKLKKRRDARQQEKAELQLRESDPQAAKKLDEEAALRRAEERMTLKHKNTSKFIRGLLKHGGTHRQRTRDAIVEQLEQEEKLRRKMGTLAEDGSDDDDSDQDEAQQAEQLHAEIVKDGDKPAERKGLFALKFMKDGLEKRRKLAEERAKQFVDAVAAGTLSDDEENKQKSEKATVPGRRKFEKSVARADLPTKDSDQFAGKFAVNPVTKSSGFVKAAPVIKAPKTDREAEESTNDPNPWLSVATRKKRKALVSGSKVVVDVSNAVAERTTRGTGESKGNGSQTKKSREQAELLHRAFVTAGVAEEDFKLEKEKEEEETDKKRKPEAKDLPGWGSWAGEGIAPKKQKKKPANEELTSAKPKRRDKKPHVIMSKKRSKKAKKYLLDKVPYPFTSREQYERSLKNPIGNDWNTVETFQKNIKPEVLTKAGTIIPPVAKTDRYEVPYHSRNVEAA